MTFKTGSTLKGRCFPECLLSSFYYWQRGNGNASVRFGKGFSLLLYHYTGTPIARGLTMSFRKSHHQALSLQTTPTSPFLASSETAPS